MIHAILQELLKVVTIRGSLSKRNAASFSANSTLRRTGFLFLVSVVLASTPAIAEYVVVDDFESYSTGDSNAGATSDAFAANGGPWQPRDISGDIAGSSIVAIYTQIDDNYLRFAYNTAARSAYRAVTNIVEGASGIYYFQVYTSDATPYQSYGLSDEATATAAGFGDFEAQVTLIDADGGVAGFNLVGRNGGSDDILASGLAVDTWYDVWLVIDNSADTYDVYFGTTATGGDPEVMGDKVGSGLGFRNGTAANDLITFMTLDDDGGTSAQGSARLDNIYYSPAARFTGSAYRFR